MTIYLWHLEQNSNTGYDTYSDCVVAARTVEEARSIDPQGNVYHEPVETERGYWSTGWTSAWAKRPEKVTATLIGIATSNITAGTVICASFHAG